MNNTVRIFLACVLGAFIGSLIALQMNHWFWWVGALVGGAVGYIGFDTRQAFSQIKVAYRLAKRLQPDYSVLKFRFRIAFAMLGISQVYLCLLLCMGWSTLPPAFWLKEEFRVITVGVQVIVFLTVFLCGLSIADDFGDSITNFLFYRYTNPVSVFFWHLPRALFFGATWLYRRIPEAIQDCKVFARFSKNFTAILFRLVHSELRLLCFVDSAIGSAGGWYFGHALTGAIIGGFLGVLNYEIVSIRVLKLAGAKSIIR